MKTNININIAILMILVVLAIIGIFFSLRLAYKRLKEGFKTTNISCDSKGCPITQLQNNIYKLHVDSKKNRDINNIWSHKTKTGNFFFNTKGPANIFIIRHGEKIKSKTSLDCNGILRSTYIPELITSLNKKGFGIHNIITTNDYNSMHQQQTVMLTSWLYSIPLFIFGEATESKEAVQKIFTNPYFNGKTVLFCWEHTCIQSLIENIITIGAKEKGLKNYTFINPEGKLGLPYWDTNNYKSILHFDDNLNLEVNDEELTTCYENDNNVLVYGKKQKCK